MIRILRNKVMSMIMIISVLLLFTSAIPNTFRIWLPVPAEIAHNYIQKFSSLAIDEMNRVHIPASIKLAQGMFESNYGRSSLAKEGKNHFGIKCKGDWKGEKVYFTDDKPNECFRKYPHVTQSYKDHSVFLIENLRYSKLFSLPITDYKGWAKGLKKAGYATDPNYHNKIIQVIEKYKLYEYDIVDKPLIVDAENICLELDEACVIQNANDDNDLLALLNIDVNKASKYKPAHEISSDLNTIDNALQASIGKRPEDIKRKCLTGAPAILVIPDRIREDIQRNKEKKRHIAGRELNPAFQPIAHCVINAEAIRSVTSIPNPSSTINSETNYSTDKSKSFTKDSKLGKLKENMEEKKDRQPSNNSATKIYKPHFTNENKKDDRKAKQIKPIEKPKKEKVNEDKANVTDNTTPEAPVPMMPSYMKRGKILPKRNTFYKNSVKAVSYPYEISPLQISKTYNINIYELLNYNDMLEDEVFLSYTNVYLEPKANKAEGSSKYHIVKNDETMWDISQMYGISLTELYKKNKMIAGKQPQNKQKIFLKGRASSSPAIKKAHTSKHNLKTKYNIGTTPEKLQKLEKDNSSGDLRLLHDTKNSQKVNVSWQDNQPTKTTKVIRYRVKAQETIGKIAQKYNVTIDNLRAWNNLQHDTLEAGQVLKIYEKK